MLLISQIFLVGSGKNCRSKSVDARHIWADEQSPGEKTEKELQQIYLPVGSQENGMGPDFDLSYGYLAKWYEDSEEIQFEGIPFVGIRDYDGYLKFKFGNYRELPPEGQRKVHPVSRIRM